MEIAIAPTSKKGFGLFLKHRRSTTRRTTTTTASTPIFLAIPLELRLTIYGYIFRGKWLLKRPRFPWMTPTTESIPAIKLSNVPSILGVNRQCRQEAQPIFYDRAKFFFWYFYSVWDLKHEICDVHARRIKRFALMASQNIKPAEILPLFPNLQHLMINAYEYLFDAPVYEGVLEETTAVGDMIWRSILNRGATPGAEYCWREILELKLHPPEVVVEYIWIFENKNTGLHLYIALCPWKWQYHIQMGGSEGSRRCMYLDLGEPHEILIAEIEQEFRRKQLAQGTWRASFERQTSRFKSAVFRVAYELFMM